jgi:hypothetical protein
MFCPICGQQQINDEVRFCSRCGLLLSDVAEVVANKGISPYKTPGRVSKKDSPKKRGVKQGIMILLVGMLLVVPLISVIHIMTNSEPFIAAIASIISFFGGILRIVYAVMFESKDESVFEAANSIEGSQTQNALPPQQSIPVNDYARPAQGSWHTTNDLVQPPSVVDETTKFLQRED